MQTPAQGHYHRVMASGRKTLCFQILDSLISLEHDPQSVCRCLIKQTPGQDSHQARIQVYLLWIWEWVAQAGLPPAQPLGYATAREIRWLLFLTCLPSHSLGCLSAASSIQLAFGHSLHDMELLVWVVPIPIQKNCHLAVLQAITWKLLMHDLMRVSPMLHSNNSWEALGWCLWRTVSALPSSSGLDLGLGFALHGLFTSIP